MSEKKFITMNLLKMNTNLRIFLKQRASIQSGLSRRKNPQQYNHKNTNNNNNKINSNNNNNE